jgi:hypothetical protein
MLWSHYVERTQPNAGPYLQDTLESGKGFANNNLVGRVSKNRSRGVTRCAKFQRKICKKSDSHWQVPQLETWVFGETCYLTLSSDSRNDHLHGREAHLTRSFPSSSPISRSEVSVEPIKWGLWPDSSEMVSGYRHWSATTPLREVAEVSTSAFPEWSGLNGFRAIDSPFLHLCMTSLGVPFSDCLFPQLTSGRISYRGTVVLGGGFQTGSRFPRQSTRQLLWSIPVSSVTGWDSLLARGRPVRRSRWACTRATCAPALCGSSFRQICQISHPSTGRFSVTIWQVRMGCCPD